MIATKTAAIKRVPKLRFPEFSDEWSRNRLSELCDMKAGRFISANEINPKQQEKLYPCYGGNGLRGYVNKFNLKGNYTLIGRQGALCGNVILVEGECYATEHAVVVYPNRTISNIWLYYQLYRLNLNNLSTGQAQPGLSVETIKSVKQFNPSNKQEQEEIAGFLSTVDEKIATIEQKVELLKKYKKAVMQKIFTQQIRFKDKNGQNFADWQLQNMGEIFEEVLEKTGNDNITETYSITAGVGFVSQKNKFGRDISGQQIKNYTLLEQNYFAYNKGNSKTYYYGCVYANHEGKPIAVPNVFISFKIRNTKMAVGYFEQLFMNHYLDKHLREIISSGARMDGLLNVNKNDFFKIKVPVPSAPEQQIIAVFLASIDEKITQEQNKLKLAKIFKKSLLQRMFI